MTRPSFSLSDVRRVRSYFLRLPLVTRGLLLVIAALYLAHLFIPGLTAWGALTPQKIGFRTRMMDPTSSSTAENAH